MLDVRFSGSFEASLELVLGGFGYTFFDVPRKKIFNFFLIH